MRSEPNVEPVVANRPEQAERPHQLRYAQSGHRIRTANIDARRSQSLSSSSGKRRLAALAALLALPLIGATVVRLLPAPSAGFERGAPVAEAVVPVAPAAVIAPPSVSVVPVAPVAPPPPPPVDKTVETKLEQNEALSSALARMGVSSEDRAALVKQLRGHLDERGVRAGAPLSAVIRPNGELARFDMKTLSSAGIPRVIAAERVADPITVESDGPAFAVEHEDAPVVVDVAGITGRVGSSLYQAMLDAGEDAVLVDKFVDIFAWNIDFYRQTQRGDTFKVLVEKKTAGGRFLGYGRVVAAEYVNAGHVHRGFPFASANGKHTGTYDENGKALMRTFLKSPMETTRITSSYGMRFHPVLGRDKKHEGVDYGAPTGTPVWSVADGVVDIARYNGGAGNMVHVKHMNGLSTEYFHLSKFAEGIRPGVRVKQKQIIGYVGSTGMSTGPHLHFGMKKNGGHVDPQKQVFPTAKPVPKEHAAEFERAVRPLMEQLAALDRV